MQSAGSWQHELHRYQAAVVVVFEGGQGLSCGTALAALDPNPSVVWLW